METGTPAAVMVAEEPVAPVVAMAAVMAAMVAVAMAAMGEGTARGATVTAVAARVVVGVAPRAAAAGAKSRSG